jgi:hypothetical protein
MTHETENIIKPLKAKMHTNVTKFLLIYLTQALMLWTYPYPTTFQVHDTQFASRDKIPILFPIRIDGLVHNKTNN